jgi:hypothetical protein
LSDASVKEIEKTISKIEKSQDPNAKFRVDQFKKRLSSDFHKKQYKSDVEE